MPLQSSNYSILDKQVAWIRRARIGDLPSMFRIEAQSFIDPYSPHLLMNLFALYPYGIFVAENETGIRGYLIMRTLAQKGHIIALAVDERYRNRVLGTQLLKKAVETLNERGATGIWLEVRVSNISAQRFYLNRGFEIITNVRGYYGDGEDAQILYKPLSS